MTHNATAMPGTLPARLGRAASVSPSSARETRPSVLVEQRDDQSCLLLRLAPMHSFPRRRIPAEARPAGAVCRVALPSAGRLGGRALRVARQPVVRDLLPGRGVGNELPEFGPHPRVAINGPQSHPRLGVVGGIAGEIRRAALAAEPLLVPTGWLPGLQRRLPAHDAKRAGHDGCVGRRRGARAPLATRAVAVARAEQRLGHFKANYAAVTTAGQAGTHRVDPTSSRSAWIPSG